MIHYNKVNWKNFAKKFLKIFPIDFQSPIDFSQLHMIRPITTTLHDDIVVHSPLMVFSLYLQEALLSIVGSVLLIYSGVMALDVYDHPELGSPAGNALGGLSIAAGILLVINLLTLAVTLRSH